MPNKLTNAGKQQLINKAEKIMGDLVHLGSMATNKGVQLGTNMQDVQQKLRYYIERLEQQQTKG